MIARNLLAKSLLFSLSLVGSLSLLGCTDDGLARRYAVSGTVKYKGEPLPAGEVTFMPDKPDGRGASGKIENGSYTLTTQDPGDGAFPGTYTVLITAKDVDVKKAEDATKKAAGKAKVEASQPDQAAMAKALASAKDLIPQKYSRVDSSGLKATVEQKSNTFDFDLKD